METDEAVARERKEATKKPQGGNNSQRWADYKEKLGKTMGENLPIRKEKANPIEPSCVIRLGEWRTEQEIQKLEHAYGKRCHTTGNIQTVAETTEPEQALEEATDTTSLESRR